MMYLGTTEVDAVYVGIQLVCKKYDGPPSPITIDYTDGQIVLYTAGVHFPADVDLTLCVAGGGGAGRSLNTDWYMGGGGSGNLPVVVSGIQAGTIVPVTIGGQAATSIFGSYTSCPGGANAPSTGGGGAGGGDLGANGGANNAPGGSTPASGCSPGFAGGGSPGLGGGGGAGIFGVGGTSNGGAGGISGGGAGQPGGQGGAGGPGRIVISWED